MICRYDMKWYVDMIWNDMVDMIEGKGLVNIEPKSLYMKVWLQLIKIVLMFSNV